ncbi:MAG: G5 domain-containing protein [Oscillibacter sp.]|nr:G5 domain-containing protein [Oscillibacter sp.]
MELLGTNPDGTYSKMTNKVLSSTPWETVYQEDPTMAPGSPDVVKVTPYTGYKVETYHTIYDKDGNVIDSHFEASSNYYVRNKVILRAPAAPTPPSESGNGGAGEGAETSVEPTPVDPAPVDPAPVEPAPVDPAPVEPAPVEPAPIEPAPLDPAPVESAPAETAPSGSEPAGLLPAEEDEGV